MADYQTQIQAITNLTFGTDDAAPTQAELTDFLVEGAKEVINRISVTAPHELVNFTTSTTVADGNGTDVNSGLVVSVTRADGVNAANLEPCTGISSDLRARASDVDSLHYASKFNPVYFILDSTLFVLPAPSDSGVNKAVVSSVFYPTSSQVAYNSTSIANFPDKYEYLVVLYATRRTLESILAYYAGTEEDIELVQAIGPSLQTVQANYDTAFGLITPGDARTEEG